MPFGAEVVESGGTRFHFWAPSVPAVRLCIEGEQSGEFPMIRGEAGWHLCSLDTAGPGTRYRFLLPDGMRVPDPASRCNPASVDGSSEVIDPCAFAWPDDGWRGRPWHEAILYELHVGTFSVAGDFAGVEARLDYLVELGVTALGIMPVAAFPGSRNWGYDGVLPYAPATAYGRPDDFKRLIAAAHARNLMVILDVVYNHFGPEGNYLHCYCPEFFNPARHTPWGAAINFDGAQNRTVRDFFIHNALYWLEEYRLDGLRLDAIHAIRDDSAPDIVEEIRDAVQNLAAAQGRHLHLLLENDRNQAHYLKSRRWRDGTEDGVAQWNDDLHHALHVIATGESDGYYADYADDPYMPLARCLVEGFAWQGESSLFRNGEKRGEPSRHLPPTAFISFLQSHDQVGNRARGERLCHLAATETLEAVTAVLLLAPQVPLLFMGEEFATRQPFLYFCDFGSELAQAVTAGRRNEFAAFARFADPDARAAIPDPNDAATYARCTLDWENLELPPQQRMHALYRRLLALRRKEIVPRLRGMQGGARSLRLGPRALRVQWTLGDGAQLTLTANLGADDLTGVLPAAGCRLFELPPPGRNGRTEDRLPRWSVIWQLTGEGEK
jgi:malto-oligosyltrehalose trehalohydrolase